MNGAAPSLFGRSLAFPPRVGADGRFLWSEGETNIRESIAVILKTSPGERVALHEFGAGLARFLFEPNNAATHARMAEAIADALQRWERRVAVESVDVQADPDDGESCLVTLAYRLVASGGRERITVAVPVALR